MQIPFSPEPGINSDDTTFSAKGRWSDGSNVRFYQGEPQIIGGRQTLFNIGNPDSAGICRVIFPFTRSGVVTIAYGLATPGTAVKLYVGSELNAPTERTPSGLTNSETNWSLAAWGSVLLACPSGGTLYEQSGTSTATAVSAAPDAITYMLVTPQRQVLALGCSEESSGTFNALCIRGSDLEDYTDWTTSSTNNAFEHIFDGGGAIVAGRIVGSNVIVWTTDSLYLGQFVGDPSQAYRFDKIDEGCGLIGPHAVVIIDEVAFWLDPNMVVRRWSAGSLPESLPCTISRDLKLNASSVAGRYHYFVASHNHHFNELRFDYADGRSGFPNGSNINNRYVAVSLTDLSWYKGIGARSALLDSQLLSGLTDNYNGKPTIISAIPRGGLDQNICIEDTGSFNNSGGAETTAVSAFLQSADFYLDGNRRRMMITRFIPDFKDQDNGVLLTVYARNFPQSTAVTKGPYTIAVGATKKDIRASGIIFAFRVEQEDSDASYFRMGTPLFEATPMGGR